MGTRGTCGFITEDKPKLSYNHFDSYPSGLGSEIIDYIKKVNESGDWDKIKEKVINLKEINAQDTPPEELYEKYKQYSDDLGSPGRSKKEWYALLRNLQGVEWMNEIMNLEHMIIDNDFIKDSLFCEYGYIINLDTMMLEFYEGFQKVPQEGNRWGTESNQNYYPCAKVLEIPLKEVDNITPSDLEREYNEETDEVGEIKLLDKNRD